MRLTNLNTINSMKQNFLLCLTLLLIITSLATPMQAAEIEQVRSGQKIDIERYQIVDILFTLSRKVDSPFEVEFNAEFTSPSGATQIIPAFYAAPNCWRVRFSASESGEWSYTTHSPVKGLNAKKGRVMVSDTPYLSSKGAVKIDPSNPQKFTRDNGDDFFLMGFECDFLYALNYHNTDATPQLDAMLDSVAANRFNYMVMNVYGYDIKWEQDERLSEIPQYMFGAKEDMFPFLGSNSEPDYSAMNFKFFDHLDRVILKLGERDIISHLMIYVWSKKVAWPELESIEGNRYFDYVVKRYQAFPNVVWDISKEALGYQTVDIDFITRRIERLRSLDSYKRLMSVHDYRYCGAHPENVDFIIKQDWDLDYYDKMLKINQKHSDKPSVNIEMGGYEQAEYAIYDNGNYYDAETCLRRNYQALFAGAYSTHYWQGVSWNVIIYDWWNQPEGHYQPKFDYYRYMVELFERYPYSTLRPNTTYNTSGYCLSDDNGLYLFYLPKESRKAEVYKLKAVSEGPLNYCWFNVTTGEYTEKVYLDSFDDFSIPPSPWFLESDTVFIIETTPKEE